MPARKVIPVLVASHQPGEVQLDAIWHNVAEFYDISLNIAVSARRHMQEVRPRQVFYYLCRKYTTLSLKQIGNYTGGRDHSTVIHGAKSIENLMSYDKKFRAQIEALERNLTGRIPPDEDPEIRIRLNSPSLGYL
jgi:chromosomal replication initiator protein